MGILDDAIREHLDLKRRRGADPAEIERAEREALGPVRRGPEEPEQDQLAYEDEGDEYGYEYEAEPEGEEQYVGESGHPVAEPEGHHADLDSKGEEETVEYEVEPHPDIERYPEVERHAESKDDPEGEDMLDETPDFFQDKPDHDRLWFERRPPRDFDFDE